MAVVLKAHVVKSELYTNIKGKNYAHVEGWQFAGGLLGLYPKVTKVISLSNDKEIKWFAKVNVVDKKNKEVVSTGYALCSNKEQNRKGFDEYAILSMAQTRAIGKAYRNILGWVMKLSGYESTPAEEMNGREESLTDNQRYIKATQMIDACKSVDQLKKWKEKFTVNVKGQKKIYGENYDNLIKRIDDRLKKSK